MTLRHMSEHDRQMDRLNDVSLAEWLSDPIAKRVSRFFPNEKARREYLSQINNYPSKEIRQILRFFLIQSQSYPLDTVYAKYIADQIKNKAIHPDELSELQRRFLIFLASNGRIPPWEGLSWVIDLLPRYPQESINIIENYIVTHFVGALHDSILYSMYDAISVIRARYITKANTDAGARRVLSSINPRDFEHLVENLYHRMRYRTTLTKQTRDGGRDIVAKNTNPGSKERLFIECKRHTRKIDAATVRRLLGIITPNQATRGAIVTTSTFTGPAIKEAGRDHRIELIDFKSLTRLLNQHSGADWPLQVDSLIADSKKRQTKATNERKSKIRSRV